MSALARTLGVSRSNLIERASRSSKPRGSYRKPDDVVLLAELRPIIDQRPTYGYRRIATLLNRQRRKEGKPVVNTKRVLRVMQKNRLNLQKRLCGQAARMMESLLPSAPISAGVPIIWRSMPAMARWFVTSLSLMPATVRSSPGRPSPTLASPAQWCAT